MSITFFQGTENFCGGEAPPAAPGYRNAEDPVEKMLAVLNRLQKANG